MSVITLRLIRAQLKGYKSIEDLTVEFETGLNILIGKNSSGKSNFLECLNKVLTVKSREVKDSYKYVNLEFLTSDYHKLIWESEKELLNPQAEQENPEERIRYTEKLFFDGNKIFDNSLNSDLNKLANIEYNGKKINLGRSLNVRTTLRRMGFRFFNPVFIKFNIPNSLDVIDIPGSIKISVEDPFWELPNSFSFLNDIFWQVEASFYSSLEQEGELKKIDKKFLLSELKIKDRIKDNLRKFSPIQDIRFSENLNIYSDEKSISVENVKIDFKLNNSWIPWSHLSDGTKRLFYLITESSNQENGFVFVEEPELGIHPHQFHLVMEFLREQAREKQVILSTHSPQALNSLDENELSHILITYYDPKKGTQIRHLSPEQMNKAKKYVKEVGFLSDYWMLSDLD